MSGNITTAMALPFFNSEQILAQLDSGMHWANDTITYRFPTVLEGLQALQGEDLGFSASSAADHVSFDLALQAWDDLMAADMVHSDSASSDIELAFSSTNSDFAHAYSPWSGSVWLSHEVRERGLAPGDNGFQAVLHELGHALGLNHMGSYNGYGHWVPSSFQDSLVYSVMSYFGPLGVAPFYSSEVAGADWMGSDGRYYSAQTPILSDVLVIQQLYGVSSTTRTGNTVYGFGCNLTDRSAELYDFARNQHPILTIFDSGGIDTLNLSQWSSAASINLEAGSYSSCNDMTNNIAIAYGCVIENACGGLGSDTINGNAAANDLQGLAGDDVLRGLDGSDTLDGGEGADTLDGGSGADAMAGGLGDDTYFVDNLRDVVVESDDPASGGTDLVNASVSYTLRDHVEHLVLTGGKALNGSGNNLDNRLTGNGAANRLDGGAGADTMVGGLGNDSYVVDTAGDVIIESGNIDRGGIDTVNASISYALSRYAENLFLTGDGAISATGNALDNSLIGNSGSNVLVGRAGGDMLDGGAGDDTLLGGLGRDVLTGGSGLDVFDFNSAAETGLDASTRDVIADFASGEDRIDLSGLDADTGIAGNNAFITLLGETAAFTQAGQLRFFDGVLYGNTDLDGDAEFSIELLHVATLNSSDLYM